MISGGSTSEPLRILIVEDCVDDFLLIENTLKIGEYEIAVKRVDNPSDMIAALREQGWDIVLSEWNLPRFSARFALAILKYTGLDLPFIIVSGAIGEEATATVMKAGAHDLVKKSDLKRLMWVVQRELHEAKERRSKKHAEAALVAAEERMKLVLKATHDVIWDWDLTTQSYHWSGGVRHLFRCQPVEIQSGAESWYCRLHPDEKDRVLKGRYAVINGEANGWSDQYRFRRGDGGYAYVLDRGYVLRDEEHRAVRMVGAMIDLTEQKQAETEIATAYERLRQVTVRMEHAEEEERKRIARELHDEFGQILTGLKLDLAWLGKRLGRGSADVSELVDRLQEMTASVDDSIHLVRKVASSLRPSVLDDLGLIPALQWQVREFEARAGIPCEIELSAQLDDQSIEPNLATALFRIAQELLTNIMRHASATQARLTLKEEGNGMLLEVVDNGRGIRERDHAEPTTLGLRGLQERVAMYGGTLQIRGEPYRGTSVTVWMPQVRQHVEHTSTV